MQKFIPKKCKTCWRDTCGDQCYDCVIVSSFILKPWGYTPIKGRKYADSDKKMVKKFACG